MKDTLRSIDLIYGYCDLLDKVKDVNLRRAQKLEQLEVNLFSRDLESASETNRNFLGAPDQLLHPSPSRVMKHQVTQTQLNIAAMIEQKYRADSLTDQLEIKKFKLQEYFDQLERNFIVSEKQIELKRQELIQRERDMELKGHELMLREKKINEYPMSCLKSDQNMVEFIGEMYKDLEKKIEEGEPGSAMSRDGPMPKSREDMTFLSFLKLDRNQTLMNKLKEMQITQSKPYKQSSVESPDSWRREDPGADQSHILIQRMY